MSKNSYLPSNIKIEYIPPEQLRPHPNNARTHSKRQIEQIADSIRRFGFIGTVLADSNNSIIAGHGRVAAALTLGIKNIPVICIDHLSEAEKRAYIIADNRLAEEAGWNNDLLAIEFAAIIEMDPGLDLEITGFETAEIDIIMGDAGPQEDPADELPEESDGPPVVRKDDLWKLGIHRLYCGDSLQPESYSVLMDGEKAQVVFCDAPYNVRVAGHVCGKGTVKHNEFAMASGEMSGEEFTGFLTTTFGHLIDWSEDGSIHFQCMDWRHIGEIIEAGAQAGYDLKNLCVWVKDNGGMGSFYRSRHELIFIFKNGQAPHINNIQLGKHGRYRTNVWEYPGVNTLKAGRMDELSMHPTVKPVAMVADALLDCSRRNDIVLDPFGGSGTTLIAAEKTGRVARLIEIDPSYCDTIIRRWQDMTGQQAIHAETGKSWNQTREARS
ncbi:MAG: ParB N-terminal domain-containing protein [Rhodospirillales bacterium]|nr:ParB N-terminal domain-containing protein [Rhodospirillales bacterium]